MLIHINVWFVSSAEAPSQQQQQPTTLVAPLQQQQQPMTSQQSRPTQQVQPVSSHIDIDSMGELISFHLFSFIKHCVTLIMRYAVAPKMFICRCSGDINCRVCVMETYFLICLCQ